MSARLRWALFAAIVGSVGLVLWWHGRRKGIAPPPITTAGPLPVGSSRVSLIDDGERVAATDGVRPFMQGSDLWRPGQPLRLFGLPGETIAFQVVITAGDVPMVGTTVELSAPRREAIELDVETFLLAELSMKRRSGGAEPGASLGWAAGAAPPGPAPGGALPDPLIPRSWSGEQAAPRPGVAPNDDPLTVPAGQHRVIWVDVAIPKDTPAGDYRGAVTVKSHGALEVWVAVGRTPLPYRALRNMLFFEPGTIERYVGAGAVDRVLQRLHRHHIAPIVPLRTVEEVERFLPMLDGSLFTETHGYAGPGMGVPTDIIVIGAYGSLRGPSPDKLDLVDAMLARLEEAGLYPEERGPDVFIYAVDEECQSPWGPAWRSALDASSRPRLQRLRVGHTCSEPPAEQAVDVVMVFAGAYDPALVAAAEKQKKRVWIYNGELPRTGAFLTDAGPLSLRANGWIQAHHRIERWFYWEGAYWTDDNAGGLGPYDPWTTAETFHNQHGDHANGDGVLLYPGRQRVDGRYQLGAEDVAPSLRLKQWRRGLQDGAYLQLARERHGEIADAISARLVEGTFAAKGQPVFPTTAQPYREARRALFELIEGQRDSD